ncbi:transcriptional regulator [Pontibacter virosus]|uniref:Uncharacterized protein n=1 Tax=Pontibacter virosus TaxID=1765052 RepID=A0A2U1AWU7_9BACT|nr:transcriptional regulator [Pontibacter virosus]PVY40906.1 hypothetical protein C8E01_106248 [Pontibacter virosus]
MNYISHLTGFFGRVSRDYRLNPTHISLYMALFQQWNLHRFRNPISIAREEVMATSRIHSRVTYHKCLRELHAWGFLHYMPSYNHYRGSLVYMLAFAAEGQGRQQQDISCTGAGQELDAGCTGSEQELSPSINKTNPLKLLNNLKRREHARAGESGTADEQASESSERKEKACAEKEKKAGQPLTPPALEEVQRFFQACAYREVEALRFFHHYSANGWKVGSQPMQDWQAAAHKWACNAFSQGEAGACAKDQPDVRDYAAPL